MLQLVLSGSGKEFFNKLLVYDRVVDVSNTSPAIWKRLLELFGDEQKAFRWLATPLSELNNRTPEQVLRDTPDGEEVSAILDRIDYGVFS